MERIGNLIKADPQLFITFDEAKTGPSTKNHPSPRIRCSLFDHHGEAEVEWRSAGVLGSWVLD
jgi:hypothetical protein